MADRTEADRAAIDHIITKLGQMIAEATLTAESQEAAAEGSSNFSRSAKHRESAEFQRALAARWSQVVEDVKSGLFDRFDRRDDSRGV